MPTSASESNHHSVEMSIFDSYSKTTLRNICRNETAKNKRLREKETVGTEVLQNIIDIQWQKKLYRSENVITDGRGHSCVVTLEWLYQAMLLLSQKQREVLILEFWCGFSVKKIAADIGVTEKTIYNRRQKAFDFIKSYYEGNEHDGS